jgi:6-pyruvoyltetrahydropterin/6-carboxytetrahydropterin synthase
MPTVATIGKVFRFEAAHQLPNHAGKCAHLHGHSYRVEVHVNGRVHPANGKSDEGMVLDFGALKKAWDPLHDRLDHQCLNDVLDFPTTAENLAAYLLDELRKSVPSVVAVRVWETATAWALVRA